MNSENFDFAQLSPKKNTLKQCQEYLKKYFVPLMDGNHAVLENGNYVIRDQPTLTKVYFNRMPKYKAGSGDDDDDGDNKAFDFSAWYFKKFTNIRSITYELNKPVFYDDKINMCPRMKHEYQVYDSFPEAIKAKVKVMLNYMNEVLASSNKSVFAYLLQWFSFMVKGNKNDSILYLKAKQGFGKSTLNEFIWYHVIGKDLGLETGSAPLISDFNARLGGKLFIYFEELETFSTGQWMSVSSRLKRYATSQTITLEDKNVKAYTAKNIMNICVLSNNDCIMDDDGRRYVILDIATHRQVIPNCNTPRNKANMDFWTEVRSCFNDEVGHAFYCYLMEVDTSNYRPQNFPVTQAKLDSYAKRLESHETFLKYNYVLRKAELKTNVGELYEEYLTYCRGNGILKPLSKIDMGKKLKESGIEPYKSNDKLKIKVSAEALQELAKSCNWIHETDEYFDADSKSQKEELPDPSGLDFGLPCKQIDNDEINRRLSDKEKECNELREEHEKMRLELEELRKWKAENATKPKEEPKTKKSVISLIDDSDSDAESVDVSDSKIAKALKAAK